MSGQHDDERPGRERAEEPRVEPAVANRLRQELVERIDARRLDPGSNRPDRRQHVANRRLGAAHAAHQEVGRPGPAERRVGLVGGAQSRVPRLVPRVLDDADDGKCGAVGGQRLPDGRCAAPELRATAPLTIIAVPAPSSTAVG